METCLTTWMVLVTYGREWIHATAETGLDDAVGRSRRAGSLLDGPAAHQGRREGSSCSARPRPRPSWPGATTCRAGLKHRSKTHATAFTPAIKSTIWQIVKTDTQGQQLANPMIDYLLWRQSLDPKRFAHFHPHLSPRLSQLLKGPSLPAGVPPSHLHASPADRGLPQTLTGPTTPSSAPLVDPAAQTVSPAAVPEPSSLILGAGMLGWGLWWRRRMSQPRAR